MGTPPAAADETLDEALKEPPALAFEDFFKVEIEAFKCQECDPAIAIHQLCQAVLKKSGKLLRVKIQEKSNPQDLQERLAWHRPRSFNLKTSTAGDVLIAIIRASLWHWERAEDGTILVNAWHRPNIEED